jgi:hypothetical protein
MAKLVDGKIVIGPEDGPFVYWLFGWLDRAEAVIAAAEAAEERDAAP